MLPQGLAQALQRRNTTDEGRRGYSLNRSVSFGYGEDSINGNFIESAYKVARYCNSDEDVIINDNFKAKIYTDWANHYLEKASFTCFITELQRDVCDGVILADVITAVTSKRVLDIKKKPKNSAQMLENISACINCLSSLGVATENLLAEEIRDGNLKTILGLFFNLSRYKQQLKNQNSPAAFSNGSNGGTKNGASSSGQKSACTTSKIAIATIAPATSKETNINENHSILPVNKTSNSNVRRSSADGISSKRSDATDIKLCNQQNMNALQSSGQPVLASVNSSRSTSPTSSITSGASSGIPVSRRGVTAGRSAERRSGTAATVASLSTGSAGSLTSSISAASSTPTSFATSSEADPVTISSKNKSANSMLDKLKFFKGNKNASSVNEQAQPQHLQEVNMSHRMSSGDISYQQEHGGNQLNSRSRSGSSSTNSTLPTSVGSGTGSMGRGRSGYKDMAALRQKPKSHQKQQFHESNSSLQSSDTGFSSSNGNYRYPDCVKSSSLSPDQQQQLQQRITMQNQQHTSHNLPSGMTNSASRISSNKISRSGSGGTPRSGSENRAYSRNLVAPVVPQHNSNISVSGIPKPGSLGRSLSSSSKSKVAHSSGSDSLAQSLHLGVSNKDYTCQLAQQQHPLQQPLQQHHVIGNPSIQPRQSSNSRPRQYKDSETTVDGGDNSIVTTNEKKVLMASVPYPHGMSAPLVHKTSIGTQSSKHDRRTSSASTRCSSTSTNDVNSISDRPHHYLQPPTPSKRLESLQHHSSPSSTLLQEQHQQNQLQKHYQQQSQQQYSQHQPHSVQQQQQSQHQPHSVQQQQQQQSQHQPHSVQQQQQQQSQHQPHSVQQQKQQQSEQQQSMLKLSGQQQSFQHQKSVKQKSVQQESAQHQTVQQQESVQQQSMQHQSAQQHTAQQKSVQQQSVQHQSVQQQSLQQQSVQQQSAQQQAMQQLIKHPKKHLQTPQAQKSQHLTHTQQQQSSSDFPLSSHEQLAENDVEQMKIMTSSTSGGGSGSNASTRNQYTYLKLFNSTRSSYQQAASRSSRLQGVSKVLYDSNCTVSSDSARLAADAGAPTNGIVKSGYYSDVENIDGSGYLSDYSGYLSEGGLSAYAKKMQQRFCEGMQAVHESLRKSSGVNLDSDSFDDDASSVSSGDISDAVAELEADDSLREHAVSETNFSLQQGKLTSQQTAASQYNAGHAGIIGGSNQLRDNPLSRSKMGRDLAMKQTRQQKHSEHNMTAAMATAMTPYISSRKYASDVEADYEPDSDTSSLGRNVQAPADCYFSDTESMACLNGTGIANHFYGSKNHYPHHGSAYMSSSLASPKTRASNNSNNATANAATAAALSLNSRNAFGRASLGSQIYQHPSVALTNNGNVPLHRLCRQSPQTGDAKNVRTSPSCVVDNLNVKSGAGPAPAPLEELAQVHGRSLSVPAGPQRLRISTGDGNGPTAPRHQLQLHQYSHLSNGVSPPASGMPSIRLPYATPVRVSASNSSLANADHFGMEDIKGSSLSLCSTTSCMSANEEKQAQDIRKLRRELEVAQEKVNTLTSQLVTNENVVNAFEQNLNNMTSRLQNISSNSDEKESELKTLRNTIDSLRQRSGQVQVHHQAMSRAAAALNKSSEKSDSMASSPTNTHSDMQSAGSLTSLNSTSSSGSKASANAAATASVLAERSAGSGRSKPSGGWLRTSLSKAFKKRSNSTSGSTKSGALSDLAALNDLDATEVSPSSSHELIDCNNPLIKESCSAGALCDKDDLHILRQELEEKDMKLTDVQLEALSSAHQLEALRDVMSRMKNEMTTLKADNERLQRIVGVTQVGSPSPSHSRQGSQTSPEQSLSKRLSLDSSTCMKSTPVFDLLFGFHSANVNVATEGDNGQPLTVSVHTGSGSGVGSSGEKATLVHIGCIPLNLLNQWDQLDSCLKKLLKEYVNQVDPMSNLGINADSIVNYQLGSFIKNKDSALPSTPPSAHIGAEKELRLTLRGTDQNGWVDSLAFESLIPKTILQRYVSLLLDHRRIMLCGPSGTGKTFLAGKLAEYLVAVSRRPQQRGAVATFNVDHKSSKELRSYLSSIAEQAESGSQDLPAVIILDNLHHVNPLSEVFNSFLTVRHQKCPYIIGTMNQATCSTTNLQLHHNFRWVLCANHMEPVKGFLGRFLRRKLIGHAVKTQSHCPLLAAIVEWMPKVWQHINRFLETHSSSDVTIGPRLFLSCPMDTEGSQVWFRDLWNYSLVPYLLEATREGLQLYGRRASWEDPADWILQTWPWNRLSGIECPLQDAQVPSLSSSEQDLTALLRLRPEDVGYDLQNPAISSNNSSTVSKSMNNSLTASGNSTLSSDGSNNAATAVDPLLSMLMRLQEAANFCGPHANDSDNGQQERGSSPQNRMTHGLDSTL